MKRDVGEVAADRAERMHVRMTLLPPIDEFDAELERALRLPQEIVLVDLQQLVELRDRRDRRLTDADDADLGGFDQRDRQSRAEHAGQGGSRHPAGGAASGNDDGSDFVAGHALASQGSRARGKAPAGNHRRGPATCEGRD